MPADDQRRNLQSVDDVIAALQDLVSHSDGYSLHLPAIALEPQTPGAAVRPTSLGEQQGKQAKDFIESLHQRQIPITLLSAPASRRLYSERRRTASEMTADLGDADGVKLDWEPLIRKICDAETSDPTITPDRVRKAICAALTRGGYPCRHDKIDLAIDQLSHRAADTAIKAAVWHGGPDDGKPYANSAAGREIEQTYGCYLKPLVRFSPLTTVLGTWDAHLPQGSKVPSLVGTEIDARGGTLSVCYSARGQTVAHSYPEGQVFDLKSVRAGESVHGVLETKVKKGKKNASAASESTTEDTSSKGGPSKPSAQGLSGLPPQDGLPRISDAEIRLRPTLAFKRIARLVLTDSPDDVFISQSTRAYRCYALAQSLHLIAAMLVHIGDIRSECSLRVRDDADTAAVFRFRAVKGLSAPADTRDIVIDFRDDVVLITQALERVARSLAVAVAPIKDALVPTPQFLRLLLNTSPSYTVVDQAVLDAVKALVVAEEENA